MVLVRVAHKLMSTSQLKLHAMIISDYAWSTKTCYLGRDEGMGNHGLCGTDAWMRLGMQDIKNSMSEWLWHVGVWCARDYTELTHYCKTAPTATSEVSVMQVGVST